METFISDLSNKEYPIADRVSAKSVRLPIMQLIRNEHSNFADNQYLSLSELDVYREKHIEIFMKKQVGKITKLEKRVLTSLKDKKTISDTIEREDEPVLTFGQRVADKIADFGGSWTFIISFLVSLLVWICLNILWLANKGFDPYPFILLNLILSMLAALQAPVIMMSQNRQESKDRDRAKKDYMINLKSELEIEMLHEKIDHLIINEQQELLEIHKTQLEILSEILKRVESMQEK
ncbi:DUF1003 domain-containing protein [Bacteroides ihuae]|uniref:DUF1003 domain-containing protein n=1 Tax=Bacteroides ihuae TaxID=1852362 RepID=UPI0008D8EF8B|nr:DUF1003 domain-containing protein [Bacteroides ihuae]